MSTTIYIVTSGDKIESAESYTKKQRAVEKADARAEADPYTAHVVTTKAGSVVYETEVAEKPIKPKKERKLREALDVASAIDGWEVLMERDNGDTQIVRKQGERKYGLVCAIHEHLTPMHALYDERVIRRMAVPHCPECAAEAAKPDAKATADA